MVKKIYKRLNSSIFRLNISYLSEREFGKFSISSKNLKREVNTSIKLDQLKQKVLDLLIARESHRGLISWCISWETHQSNGLAHLDILLRYKQRCKKSPTSFDYLLPLCPQDLGWFGDNQGKKSQIFLTGYGESRLNQAILEYGEKEDPVPVTNFSKDLSAYLLAVSRIKQDSYGYFYDLMIEDPYNFDLSYWAVKYNLSKEIKGWSAIKNKLNDCQAAARALTEERKPGIKEITPELIEGQLTKEELKTFNQYPCFKEIVAFINQIPRWGHQRPHKTLNLFLWGPKGIGKTSFLTEGPKNLSKLVPHYDINLQNKYLNRYYNNVYGFISWNQFKYTDFTPNWVLKLLEGANLEIPIRYASNIKRDNPLIIATSNMSLKEHIERRFKEEPRLREMAKSNLLNERIVEIEVPVEMFFLQKLLIPNINTPSTKAES